MNILVSHISAYIKKYPNKSLNNFIPEFKKIFNPTDITIFNNLTKNTIKKNILYKNKEFEIVKIDWGPKSSTLLHDHPQRGCIMILLKGNLIEEVYNNSKNIINNLKFNNISYIHNKIGLHKVSNPYNTDATSLHIYSPPCKIT